MGLYLIPIKVFAQISERRIGVVSMDNPYTMKNMNVWKTLVLYLNAPDKYLNPYSTNKMSLYPVL